MANTVAGKFASLPKWIVATATILLLFLIAYAAGAGVGPVTLVHGRSGPGMHMGAVRLIGRP